MRKNISYFITVFFTMFAIIFFTVSTAAHSGRTDSSGGHRDTQDQSGLGSYHYHCGGHPPHLHESGQCPYDASAQITEEQAPSEPTVFITSEPTPIEVESICILSPDGNRIAVGDTLRLSAKVSPADAEVSTLIWSTDNAKAATVDQDGKVKARSAGNAGITVSTQNGTVDRYEITVFVPIWMWILPSVLMVIAVFICVWKIIQKRRRP